MTAKDILAKASNRSELELLLLSQLRVSGFPKPEEEFRFHPIRKFRFDFAWPEHKVAVEVEGATWVGGRHTRGTGYARDAAKYNLAVLEGWKVLRFTKEMVESGEAVLQIGQLVPTEGRRQW